MNLWLLVGQGQDAKGSGVSTIDLCGGKWSLLIGTQDAGWNEAAQSVTREIGLLIAVHSILRLYENGAGSLSLESTCQFLDLPRQAAI